MLRSSFVVALVCTSVSFAGIIPRAQNLYDCVHTAFGTDDASLRIVSPTDPTWTDARIGESIQYKENPQLIAYAKNANEVSSLLACAQQNNVAAVPRNGGHQ